MVIVIGTMEDKTAARGIPSWSGGRYGEPPEACFAGRQRDSGRMTDPADADALQHAWLLPFEVVDLTPELVCFTPAVVADDGALFQPSAPPGLGEAETGAAQPALGPEYGFGIAARVSGAERCAWTPDWAAAATRAAVPEEDMAATLVRVQREGGAERALELRRAEPVRPRPILAGPTAVLLDLGMVLTRFDRSLFGKNFLSVFGQPVPAAAEERLQKLRPALESGELLADDFLEQVLEPLELVKPDKEALARVWSSILSVKRSTLALMRRVAELPDVAVVVVSNTDPLMLRYLRSDLGLADLAEHMAASCQDGVNPKSVDASLWQRGREIAATKLGAEPRTVIAVDDIRAYLEKPLAAGIADHAIHYRHFAQFKYALGALGLYVPLDWS